MKTDYELIKDFPKVLYQVTYTGEVEERKVKEAHFCGKYGIEIDLGNGEYIYDKTCKSHQRDYDNRRNYWENYGFSYASRFCCYYVNKERAHEASQQFHEEEEIDALKIRLYSAYCGVKRAKGILTYDFSK